MNITKTIQTSFLTPLKALRLRYVPLLMIYFAFGASAFTGIAESFWVKEKLSLEASELVALGVWLTVPWTIKMVFGQMVDSIKIFGSSRRVYVYIGASLMVFGNVLLIALAKESVWINFASKEIVYILSSVISIVGFVLQDVVADTMSTEVVDKNQSQENIEKELAMIQVLGRISLAFAGILVAGIGGWLAQVYSYETIFTLGLIIPVISIIGVSVVKLDVAPSSPLNCKIFCGGLAYATFVILMGYNSVPFAQEIIFVVSLGVILYMLREVIGDLNEDVKSHIIKAIIVIFVFRAMPSVGPALQWWQIDILGFDKAFFGTLAQIGSILALVGLWVGSTYVVKQSIAKVLIFLTVISFLLSLPIFGMVHGLHEWTYSNFGIDAREIALIDTAIASPFNHISMVLMLTLVAIYAPSGKKGTWFALMASLMNLALSAAGLISKYLNKLFVVTREIKDKTQEVVTSADYSQLSVLLLIVILINLTVPLITIWKFNPKEK
jgi:hypothetical protein